MHAFSAKFFTLEVKSFGDSPFESHLEVHFLKQQQS